MGFISRGDLEFLRPGQHRKDGYYWDCCSLVFIPLPCSTQGWYRSSKVGTDHKLCSIKSSVISLKRQGQNAVEFETHNFKWSQWLWQVNTSVKTKMPFLKFILNFPLWGSCSNKEKKGAPLITRECDHHPFTHTYRMTSYLTWILDLLSTLVRGIPNGI